MKIAGLTALMMALASVAQAQPVVDDAFTHFVVENHSTSRNGRPVDEGWALVASFRLFGSVAPRSALRFVLKKGNREIARTTCEGSRGQWNRNIARGPETFFVSNCIDRAQRITDTGDFTVDVVFLDDATDAETTLRTLKLRVATAERVGGTGEPIEPHHFVDHSPEVLGTVMHLQNMGAVAYHADTRSDLPIPGSNNQVVMYVPATPNGGAQGSLGAYTNVRCTVDGQRLEMPSDRVSGMVVRHQSVQASRGRARADQGETTSYGSMMMLVALPISFDTSHLQPTHDRVQAPSRQNDVVYLHEHPGVWECQWRMERDVLRTWRWTVGANGRVVPHPEQAAGLSLGPNAFLVETVLPAAATPYDAAVDRAAIEERAFYGLGWRSEAGRAAAARAPSFGEATPRGRAAAARPRGRRR